MRDTVLSFSGDHSGLPSESKHKSCDDGTYDKVHMRLRLEDTIDSKKRSSNEQIFSVPKCLLTGPDMLPVVAYH